MPEPEIARRCPTCGASIRDAALFCPQCGKALPQQKTGQPQKHAANSAPEGAAKNTAPLDGSDVESEPNPESDTVALEKPEPAPRTPDPQSMSDTVAIEKPAATPRTPAGPRVRGAVGAKIHRATTLARDVEGDVVHRVKKVRKISSVVLDEAGYDPSLRFVLVAAALFILFLIIVLLNKFIT